MARSLMTRNALGTRALSLFQLKHSFIIFFCSVRCHFVSFGGIDGATDTRQFVQHNLLDTMCSLSITQFQIVTLFALFSCFHLNRFVSTSRFQVERTDGRASTLCNFLSFSKMTFLSEWLFNHFGVLEIGCVDRVEILFHE